MHQEIWFQKYRILDLLGRGGNAKVYLAEHIKLNSFRAIKFISKNHPLYDLQCKEAIILKNLKHFGIPIICDIEEDEYGSYIVEQYLEGETLKKYVSLKGPFQENLIINYALQLCDLIRYLHSLERPILYVDLKPDNIILSEETLKIIDFGSAQFLDEIKESQKYQGTRGYAAPELYRHNKIDERCDVYGIGMLMYFMATGLYIGKESLRIENIDRVGKCSKQLKRVINNCLKYNPSQRCASVSWLSKQLLAMLKKTKEPYESSQTIKISVAGAQPRIGATHLAFRLCKYFNGQRQKCLYQEKNNSGCVWSIKNIYENVVVREGINIIEKIPMLANMQNCMPDIGNYKVTVRDFGGLTEGNLEEFLKSDVKLLILGAKDWELEFSEQIINLTAEYKDITYLFNFMNGRQFQEVMRSMERKDCYRIPYSPDPFAKVKQRNELDFFRELLNTEKKVIHKEKLASLFKRR